MSATSTVQTGLKAWENRDEATMASLVAEDFVITGATPQPLNKEAFIGLMHATLTAMPDWAFNASGFEEDGDTVTLKSRITGTHTGPLELPGMPPIPATGKKVALPEETQIYTLRDGKLVKLQVEDVPGGGIPGMLQQIGVALPQG